MSPDLWLPPGARRFDAEVERVIEESDDPAGMRRHAEVLHEHGVKFPEPGKFGDAVTPESALILMPFEWGRVTTAKGEDALAAFVESAELKRMILDGNLHPEGASIVDVAENPIIQALCPALHLRLREFQTFTPLEYEKCPCPVDWMKAVQEEGFALAMKQEDDDRVVYVSTGPLLPAGGIVLPPRSRAKAGRNDPCPCGSGIKFKRCCGT